MESSCCGDSAELGLNTLLSSPSCHGQCKVLPGIPVSLNILDAIVESKVREDLVWENKRTTIPK